MKHLSLFSGIGGLDLAAEWAGFETVAFVERDPYCQRVLAKHWPGVPIIDNVRSVVAHPDDRRLQERAISVQQSLQGSGWEVADANGASKGGIGIISGGFPCQPHSVAGKRQASADDRDLWPEFARVIREIRPRWVVAENVPGLLSSESGRFFGTVLRDLAEMGYSAGWGVWGACDVGALHRRDRVWIVTHRDDGQRLESIGKVRTGRHAAGGIGKDVAHAECIGQPRPRQPLESCDPAANGDWEAGGTEHVRLGEIWSVEPDVGRVAHGVPARVDRLRALGNAVVPQQAYPLFAAIAERERMNNAPSQFHVKER